ncbi:hypothetical protein [Streptomyces sp. T028]|uniref:hypothetical protein n=1 Tax=Streptomyces sp. T028 TaxID=3394379 RepID=UPI003A86C345
MSARPGGTSVWRELPPECVLARRRGYEDVHAVCRQLRDIPLPHGAGLLLVHRCGCDCHGPVGLPVPPPRRR